jgi:hypothetical protein
LQPDLLASHQSCRRANGRSRAQWLQRFVAGVALGVGERWHGPMMTDRRRDRKRSRPLPARAPVGVARPDDGSAEILAGCRHFVDTAACALPI